MKTDTGMIVADDDIIERHMWHFFRIGGNHIALQHSIILVIKKISDM
ncbi:hypothetical protein [uncultured Shewanella sp.]|nr:hypothetical protein [uncultured Shewanella sp.]